MSSSAILTPKATRKVSSPKKTPQFDRFIPSRSSMDFDLCNYNVQQSENTNPSLDCSPAKEEYQSNLAESMFHGKVPNKILAFRGKAPTPVEQEATHKVLYSQNKIPSSVKKTVNRVIPSIPEKILDAPGLLDDYYLNLLDWNSNNVLAVALGQTVYLWNASTSSIYTLLETPEAENNITSLSWVQEGNYLAVGTAFAEVQLWDVERMTQCRSMRGHRSRVGALAWNSYVLSSGSRDSTIFHHDVRVENHHIATLRGHTQEVCGLKWSHDGSQLASGGNDNLLNIWDYGSSTARFSLDHHQAAVKALAWCPWQGNLLASGGGAADRHIRFWNTQTGACLNAVDTKSQVCSIQWSRHQKELVSGHGFSQNQLILWKYPTMHKIAELNGHTSRVLNMATSPDGTTVVSAAGDETLRFWKIFAPNDRKASSALRTKEKSSLGTGMSIR